MENVRLGNDLIFSSEFKFTNCTTGRTEGVHIGITENGEAIVMCGNYEVSKFKKSMIEYMLKEINNCFNVE